MPRSVVARRRVQGLSVPFQMFPFTSVSREQTLQEQKRLGYSMTNLRCYLLGCTTHHCAGVAKGNTVMLPEYGGQSVKLGDKELFLYRDEEILGLIEQP